LIQKNKIFLPERMNKKEEEQCILHMKHIDLFEAQDGDFYMVPDRGDTVYGHWAEATSESFAYVARSIIEDEDGYREGYGNIHGYASVAKLLADPATIHIADYTAGEEDKSTCYRNAQRVLSMTK